jgi:single-strand DNA-binding protein
MNDVNNVILIGRLTRDAELKYTTAGFPISNFSIAVNRRRKNGDQWVDDVNYFDITLFGKSAESLKQYLVKGKQIAVEGELKQDSWEQDGQSRSKVVITANNVQLLGGGQPGGAYGGGSGGGSPAYGMPPQGGYPQAGGAKPAAPGDKQSRAAPPGGGYDDDFEDDIPF